MFGNGGRRAGLDLPKRTAQSYGCQRAEFGFARPVPGLRRLWVCRSSGPARVRGPGGDRPRDPSHDSEFGVLIQVTDSIVPGWPDVQRGRHGGRCGGSSRRPLARSAACRSGAAGGPGGGVLLDSRAAAIATQALLRVRCKPMGLALEASVISLSLSHLPPARNSPTRRLSWPRESACHGHGGSRAHSGRRPRPGQCRRPVRLGHGTVTGGLRVGLAGGSKSLA